MYTHGVIAYLLYARRSLRERRLAALGGVLPDAILALGFVPHALEPLIASPWLSQLHALLHFSALHLVTVAMHSLLLVGLALALAAAAYRPLLPCLVGMFAHGVADLLTHQRWAYNHFFPLPLAPFVAPVDYTTFGFTVAEHLFLLLVGAWWLRRRRRLAA